MPEHHHEHHEEGLKGRIIKIAIAVLLLIAAVIVEKTCGLNNWQLLLVYLVPYLFIGFETLKEAAEGGVPRPKFEETSQETRKAPQEPPKPQPTEKPTAPVEATPDTKPVTLDAVQRAAAQMRDDGKLKAVTDMFPDFGIKKLSDLKGDQLQQFGERLRAMGAKI